MAKRLALVLQRRGRRANGHGRLADGAAGFFSPPGGRLKVEGLVRVLARQLRAASPRPGPWWVPGSPRGRRRSSCLHGTGRPRGRSGGYGSAAAERAPRGRPRPGPAAGRPGLDSGAAWAGGRRVWAAARRPACGRRETVGPQSCGRRSSGGGFARRTRR